MFLHLSCSFQPHTVTFSSSVSQPYFSGTRSLSPMSSLFGSIWTPQSEPYQSHFQPERSAPITPVSPISPPLSPYSREPEGGCRPIQYSSFNPFGPHMNLDIWNSSSNRSSNSQLSNDSGYCGDAWEEEEEEERRRRSGGERSRVEQSLETYNRLICKRKEIKMNVLFIIIWGNVNISFLLCSHFQMLNVVKG